MHVSRQLIAHQDLTPLELFDMRANVSENNSLHDAEAEQGESHAFSVQGVAQLPSQPTDNVFSSLRDQENP